MAKAKDFVFATAINLYSEFDKANFVRLFCWMSVFSSFSKFCFCSFLKTTAVKGMSMKIFIIYIHESVLSFF